MSIALGKACSIGFLPVIPAAVESRWDDEQNQTLLSLRQ
jgi:hypothetical protein